MPNTGLLGWAYVTGSQTVVTEGSGSMVAFYSGSAPCTVLSGSSNFLYDFDSSKLVITGNLDVSGTINALAYKTVTYEDTTLMGTTQFGNDTGDLHQFTGSMEISGAATPALTVLSGNVVFNEIGDKNDFRVESDDETHMLFVDAGANAVSIGDSINAPAATLEVTNHATAGAYNLPLLQLNSNDTNQVALDINAANIDANVIDIVADAVTTANVLKISADGLTTGNAIKVEDNCADINARSVVEIVQENGAARQATGLKVQSDGGMYGIQVDKNFEYTGASTVKGLEIDLDKTEATDTNNYIYGVDVTVDNTSATDGYNTAIGGKFATTLYHAADSEFGVSIAVGVEGTATGKVGSYGTGVVYGGKFIAQEGDLYNVALFASASGAGSGMAFQVGVMIVTDNGSAADIHIESSTNEDDWFRIVTTDNGATTISTVDNDDTLANLTMTIGGDITMTAAGATTGSIEMTSGTATASGGGFNASNVMVDTFVSKVNGETVTTLLIDIGAGSIVSSNSAGDVIGENDTANAYITRITTAINGIVYSGEISCIEVPTTGDPDVNLCANSDGTIAEDAAGEGGEVLVNAGVWTLGQTEDIEIPEGGIVDDYLYLTHGGTTAGTYNAGKFIIKLYGASF